MSKMIGTPEPGSRLVTRAIYGGATLAAGIAIDRISDRHMWPEDEAEPRLVAGSGDIEDCTRLCFAFEGYGRRVSDRLAQLAVACSPDNTIVAYPSFGARTLDTRSIGRQMAHLADMVQPETVTILAHSTGARIGVQAAGYGGVPIDRLYGYEMPGSLDDVTWRMLRMMSRSPYRGGPLLRVGALALQAAVTRSMPHLDSLGLDHSAQFTGRQADLLRRPLDDPSGVLGDADIVHFVGENPRHRPFIDPDTSSEQWRALPSRSFEVRVVPDGTHVNLWDNPSFRGMLSAAMTSNQHQAELALAG